MGATGDINSSSNTEDFTEILKGQSACAEAIDWCSEHFPLSVGELLDEFQADKEAEASWATWALLTLGERISIDIRKKFLAKIRDSGWAFYLYCKLSWLTDEEDGLLLIKFEGKVPEGEKQLELGIITREKK